MSTKIETTKSHAELTQERDLQKAANLTAIAQPLVNHMFTADPSAHVFNGKIFIYPSHDIASDAPINDNGDQYAMRDYHVFSLNQIDGEVTDHGNVLDVDDVDWAEKQMWAPDAAEKNGLYYLYFPARDYQGIFRLGVAVSDKPEGPFKAQPEPIKNSFSIDPAIYQDEDNQYYAFFGGIWGGQLQRWSSGTYLAEDHYPADDQPALLPKVAKLADDMLEFCEDVRDVEILDENGELIKAGDNDRRFFEGPWLHKYNDKYYFSYSTGDTHKIVYATGDSPYGPFTYQGIILEPVLGWTTHHSIVEFEGKWYLFYHDCTLSGGQTHLRSIKMTELTYDENGKINTIKPYK
ncbi:glycoside hydrolase family 43 protein [Catenovulum sp. 2E275]|uniref:glycoside hydrolase family 43 protein n=1 Tax=Catenovulum sp. 2E275 TaxID=2980497 RepID=UPI0021CF85E4|nr:glycoside hydrolase family 43 protein [Catenovulum sp. 2E275]MCU4674071.1 glycoside hydrolase family 43 protein [Catenovulum sp. 2E275]